MGVVFSYGGYPFSFGGKGGETGYFVSVHFICGAGTMLLGGVSISYGCSLFIGGVGHFLAVVFFIGMGYGIVPATPPHGEQRSRDQLLPYTRSKVNDTVL